MTLHSPRNSTLLAVFAESISIFLRSPTQLRPRPRPYLLSSLSGYNESQTPRMFCTAPTFLSLSMWCLLYQVLGRSSVYLPCESTIRLPPTPFALVIPHAIPGTAHAHCASAWHVLYDETLDRTFYYTYTCTNPHDFYAYTVQ